MTMKIMITHALFGKSFDPDNYFVELKKTGERIVVEVRFIRRCFFLRKPEIFLP